MPRVAWACSLEDHLWQHWQEVGLRQAPHRGVKVVCIGLSLYSTLNLGVNLMTGTIPTNIGALTALQSLDLHSNYLTGPIPDSIGNLTSLTLLRLANSSINSTLPSTLAQLSQLAYVRHCTTVRQLERG